MIQFDEHIFQMGWFNHQPAPVTHCIKPFLGGPISPFINDRLVVARLVELSLFLHKLPKHVAPCPLLQGNSGVGNDMGGSYQWLGCPIWMSRPGSGWINGDRIKGLFHLVIFMGWSKPLIRSPLIHPNFLARTSFCTIRGPWNYPPTHPESFSAGRLLSRGARLIRSKYQAEGGNFWLVFFKSNP